jgi:glyoxylase-like metal-dependent hydrolase (beta-lactamase superfamily II)
MVPRKGGQVPHGTIRVGGVQITALCDVVGNFPAPLARVFPGVPAPAWEPFRRRYPETFDGPDRWRLHDHCFLLRGAGRAVLLDLGVGPPAAAGAEWIGTPGRLPDELHQAGCEPGEVDTVVLSHLHLDHIGWAVTWDGERPRATFPGARHLVQRADWEAFSALGDDDQAAFDQAVKPLADLGAVEILSGDHPLGGGLDLLHTPGHTPGSQSLLVQSDGERALLWGDVANHPAQVTETTWCSRADFDPGQADSTRRALLDRIEAEGMTLATAHFPEPFGEVVRVEGRRWWRGYRYSPELPDSR